MENYRRPTSSTRDARHDVEGVLPTKTKIADQTTQPYRRSVLQQQQTVAPTRPKLPPLDMDLPDGDSFNRHHMQPRIKKQVRRARVIFMRTALASMALLIGLGGLLFSQGFLNMRKVFKGTAEQAASLQETVDPNQLKGEGDGRINMLLTGIGGEKHAGGNLTDTLMLASIDPVNHTAALLSVPRDMWVTIPGKGSMKINAGVFFARNDCSRITTQYQCPRQTNCQGWSIRNRF